MEGCDEGREYSAEELLIYAVLETFVTDMRLAPRRRECNKKMQFILDEARSEWTAELCMWLDLDHSWFCQILENMARQSGYETRI